MFSTGVKATFWKQCPTKDTRLDCAALQPVVFLQTWKNKNRFSFVQVFVCQWGVKA